MSFFKKSQDLNWPNTITMIRIILTFPILLFWTQGNYIITGILLVIAIVSDIFDGWLARKTNRVTKFGKWLDPAADKIFIIATLFVIGVKYLPIYQISILVLLEIIITVGAISNPIIELGRKMGSNIFGKLKMILQCLALSLMFVGPICLSSPITILGPIIEVLVWLAIICATLSLIIHALSKDKSKTTS